MDSGLTWTPRWRDDRTMSRTSRPEHAVGSVLHGEHPPGPGHALELVLSSVTEDDPRPRDQVGNRSRHPDLTGLRERFDSRRDVHTDPGDVVAAALDLAGVQADAHVQTELACAFAQGEPTLNRPRG